MSVLSFDALSTAIQTRASGFRADYSDTVHASNFNETERDILRTLMLEASQTSGSDLTLTGNLAAGGDVSAVGGAFSGDVSVTGELTAGSFIGSTQQTMTEITGDGAVGVTTSGVTYLSKGSAAAISIAAPAAGGLERQILSVSDFAHVVTFTGSTLNDGTTGNSVTATFAAFKGASLTVISLGGRWYVKANNLVTIT